MRTFFLMSSLIFIFSCKKEKGENINTNKSSDSSDFKIEKVSENEKFQTIESIKKEYNTLNTQLKSKSLDSTSFDYDCNNERSGKVIFYSDKEGIKVIEHSYAEYSHFSSVEKYFIKDRNVFFIFKEETEWSFDGGTPEKPITKDDITESRIYLQNNNAVKCLEKQYTIRSGSSDNPDPDKIPNKEVKCSIEELMKTYQLLVKNKGKKGEIKCL